jgi:ribosomal protein S18 acetylase RimI-like enzyme
MVSVEKLSPSLAKEFKTARLSALQDTPTAFTGTYSEESRLSDEDWIHRAAAWSSGRSTCYLGMAGAAPCGIIAGKGDDRDPQRAYVLSMWVAPAYRRTGLGSRLMRAVESWAEDLGFRELRLLVTSNNKTAQHFYKRGGFTLSGLTQPYPHDPALSESEMVKYIGGNER